MSKELKMPKEFWGELTDLSIKWGGGDMHIMEDFGNWFAKWADVYALLPSKYEGSFAPSTPHPNDTEEQS